MVNEINTIEELLSVCSKYIDNNSELETIKKAYEYASKVHKNDVRKSGDSYMKHPLNTAYILTDLQADRDTLSAALLHDTVHIGHVDIKDIEKNFGKDITSLVNGILR